MDSAQWRHSALVGPDGPQLRRHVGCFWSLGVAFTCGGLWLWPIPSIRGGPNHPAPGSIRKPIGRLPGLFAGPSDCLFADLFSISEMLAPRSDIVELLIGHRCSIPMNEFRTVPTRINKSLLSKVRAASNPDVPRMLSATISCLHRARTSSGKRCPRSMPPMR